VEAVTLCCAQVEQCFGLKEESAMIDVSKFFFRGSERRGVMYQNLIMLRRCREMGLMGNVIEMSSVLVMNEFMYR
jgi:hypothetical protein